MDNVNFEAKTNWKQDETVYPQDANRWEKGIKDCADLVNDHNARIPAAEKELPKKVNKAGDTMTGALKMSGDNEVRFGTDDNFYYVKKGTDGLMQGNGTDEKRLLTTADFEGVVPDYSAGIAVTYPYTAPRTGLFVARTPSGANTITVNGVNTNLQFNGGNSASVIVRAGDVVNVTGSGPATCYFFPLKGV